MGRYKVKSYTSIIEDKERTIFVYGEMREFKELIGQSVVSFKPVTLTIIRSYDDAPIMTMDDSMNHKMRVFNMGYAICQKPDVFSKSFGIRIAKRRFTDRPLRTQNGKFLNDDMCQALVDNEAKYIKEHLEKFINTEED